MRSPNRDKSTHPRIDVIAKRHAQAPGHITGQPPDHSKLLHKSSVCVGIRVLQAFRAHTLDSLVHFRDHSRIAICTARAPSDLCVCPTLRISLSLFLFAYLLCHRCLRLTLRFCFGCTRCVNLSMRVRTAGALTAPLPHTFSDFRTLR